MAKRWSMGDLAKAVGFVLVTYALWEWLVGDGSFRLQDLGGWAFFVIVLAAFLILAARTTSLWAEAVAFGVFLAVLAAGGGPIRGGGLDLFYVGLAFVGGAALWSAVFWLIERFGRWAKRYGERHGLE